MSLFYRTLLPIFCLCYVMNKRHIQFPFHYRKIRISFYVFSMVKRYLCLHFICLFESINCQKSLTAYFVLHNEEGKNSKLYDNWFYVRYVIGLYLWLLSKNIFHLINFVMIRFLQDDYVYSQKNIFRKNWFPANASLFLWIHKT